MAKRPTTRRKTTRKTTPSRAKKAKPRARKTTAAAAQPVATTSRGAATAMREGRSVPENFHALYDRGFRSSRGLAAPSGAPATSASARRMSREVQGLEIHYDQTTQLPNMIVAKAPSAPLARAASRGAAQTPEGAVAEFVRSKADLWQLSADDAATIEVVSVSAPRGAARPPASRGGARSAARSSFSLGNLKTVNLVQRIEVRGALRRAASSRSAAPSASLREGASRPP